jgi:cell division protein FtsB
VGLSKAAPKGKADLDRKLLRGRRPKRRKFVLFLLSLFIIWIIYLFVGGDYGLIKIISLKRHERQLRAELLKVMARREVLLKEIERLKKDPATIEKFAREELGMIREGEIRYQFPPESTQQRKPPRKSP